MLQADRLCIGFFIFILQPAGTTRVLQSAVKMSSSLLAKSTQTAFEGDGGSYYTWLSSAFPILSESKLGGGILSLKPLGFALPHYADSAKIGYVTQGCGSAGVVLPGAKQESVLKLNKGDMIPVPIGGVSWWFNNGTTDFSMVFLGDTSKAHSPGNFTYFFIIGALGLFNGFSADFLKTALGMSPEETNRVVKSQTGALIVKLKQNEHSVPEPSEKGAELIVYNTESAKPNSEVKGGGRLVVMSSEELEVLKEVGLSSATVKLDKNAMYVPQYLANPGFQLNYVVKGGGCLQIVGLKGQNALDVTVKAGELFVVPRFFVVSAIAGGEGMEWFSVFTTPKPVFTQLTGSTSVWKALSPGATQAAINTSAEVEASFRKTLSKDAIFIPQLN